MKLLTLILTLIACSAHAQWHGGMALGKSFGTTEELHHTFISKPFANGDWDTTTEAFEIRTNHLLFTVTAGKQYQVTNTKLTTELEARIPMGFDGKYRKFLFGLKQGLVITEKDDDGAPSFTPWLGIFYGHVSNDYKFLNSYYPALGLRYKRNIIYADVMVLYKSKTKNDAQQFNLMLSIGGLDHL